MHLQITSLGLETNPMLLCGIGLLLIGFGFKVAAVPFHMWAPDVYDGAPTPITAFMAAAVKAAAFTALIRVLLHALGASDIVWTEIVLWLSVITMIVGNLVALAQTQLKRMLAYSSIGHAGYILAAVASGSEEGARAFVFYVLVYTLMTLGSFGILAAIGRRGERDVRIDDLSGLGSHRPWMAFAMTVFMLSLLGFPGTAGFIGKWLVLSSVIQADQVILAVMLVLASVVSAAYYLPVVMAMYMKPAASGDSHSGTQLIGAARWVVGMAAVLLLLLGVWPNRVMDMAADGAEGLRSAPTRVFTD
jgi:NADH-quinone oxidoreductase subunit N